MADDVGEVRRMLRSPVAVERRAAVRTVRERGMVALLPDLVAIAPDRDPFVRFEIAGSIKVIVKRELAAFRVQTNEPTLSREAIATLRERLNRITGQRDALILGEALPEAAFVAASRSDGEVAEFATRLLRVAPREEAAPDDMPVFRDCIVGADQEWEVLYYLSERRPEPWAPIIRRVMNQDPERAPFLVKLDSRSLTTVSDAEWRVWLDSPWPQVRQTAIRHLGERKDRAAWSKLVRLTEHSSVATRLWAMNALIEIDAARAYGPFARRLERAKGEELAELRSLGSYYQTQTIEARLAKRRALSE